MYFMKEIEINGLKYRVIENVKDALDIELLAEKITDYFADYDYIVGDWAYGKVRLKGFNNKAHKNFKDYNDIGQLSNYVEKYCAYGCSWFQIERIRD